MSTISREGQSIEESAALKSEPARDALRRSKRCLGCREQLEASRIVCIVRPSVTCRRKKVVVSPDGDGLMGLVR